MKTGTIRWLIFGMLMISFSVAAFAQIGIGISVSFGPPPLPVYEQPVCPGSGYLWTPGYWGWSDDDGYYWVPGTWVTAPEPGLLWTPGYWGWNDGAYVWNDGYWGPEVGFYGGIDYGFGYTGQGFYGGEWRGGSFYYNSAVMNVRGAHITNVYEKTVVVNNNHVSYNGGQGGVAARPSPQQEQYAHAHHTEPLPAQRQQAKEASQNRAFFASQNHGRPAIAATAKPGDFKTHVVAARAAGGAYHPPAISPRQARVKPGERPSAPRQAEQRNARENRTAEANRNAGRQASREHPEQKAQQQKTEQKNAERQQAQQQKTEQKNAERQQAQQQKTEQNTERQQARLEQKQQAHPQRAEQPHAQAKPTPQHAQPTQHAEQKRGGKPEKGPGR